MLPLVLALPAAFDLARIVVVTQTLVELVVMVVLVRLVRLVPRLVPVVRGRSPPCGRIVHMDSPCVLTDGGSGGGLSTRERLLAAAAELIAESGWGRVTTRAVAERAGLPHGTVSYHFRGKQALLVEAAVNAVEGMFPDSELAAMRSVEELFAWTSAAALDAGAGSAQASVLLEAMRESSRDAQLRERIAAVLQRLRQRVADLVAAEHGQRRDAAGVSAEAVATAIVAAGDGLWLHSLLDPGLDVSGAVAAISRLARPDFEDGEAS